MWELGYSLVRFMHSVPDIADPEGTSQQVVYPVYFLSAVLFLSV